MADHIIPLNDKQEAAAAAIVYDINHPYNVATVGNLTVDKWLKDLVIGPIKTRINLDDATRLAQIEQALPDATNNQLNQIKVILGIP